MSNPMEPKAFQAELCAAIVNRLNAQHVRGQATRTKAAIDILCGAAQALHMTGSDYYNGVSILAVLTSARGVEVVEKTARGEPL